jgi:hypothetical protein
MSTNFEEKNVWMSESECRTLIVSYQSVQVKKKKKKLFTYSEKINMLDVSQVNTWYQMVVILPWHLYSYYNIKNISETNLLKEM